MRAVERAAAALRPLGDRVAAAAARERHEVLGAPRRARYAPTKPAANCGIERNSIAIIAIGRHIINLDFENVSRATLAGIAALVAALAAGYYLVRKVGRAGPD